MPSATRALLDWLLLSPQRPHLDTKEWDEVIAQAVAHTVAPQLFRSLMAESNSVPPNVLQCAAVAMMWQKQQSSRIERDLATTLSALNGVGVTPILLKGAHLATLIYPQPCDRPMSDIDVLVHLDETEKSERALIDVGFTSEWATRTRQIRFVKKDAVDVEFHWAICKPRDQVAVDHDGLWQRSVPLNVLGHSARVFSAEDLLLHICLHAGISHQFAEKGLRPLFDILAILERHGQTLDWNVIERRAREWRIERAAYLMLELARREGNAAIPEDILSKLRPRRVSRRVYEAARAQIFEAPGVNLYPIAPSSIALAWASPRATWMHLRSKDNRKRETVAGELSGHLSQYARYLWHCLRHDRGRLKIMFERTRRHFILSNWFAGEL